MSMMDPYHDAYAREKEFADLAREYIGARLAMGEGKEDWLPMLCRVDAAWADLLNAYDAENA